MKTKLFFILILLLTACQPTPAPAAPQANPTATFTATATSTAIATKTPVLGKVEEPISVPSLTTTPFFCAEPLTPANGTNFPAPEKVIFSWTAMENAATYILNVTMPSNDLIPFESEATEITRYIEAFVQGGEYRWNVTALNAAGEEICTSETFTFTKPETPQEPTPKPQDAGSDENSDPCGGPGCDTGDFGD